MEQTQVHELVTQCNKQQHTLQKLNRLVFQKDALIHKLARKLKYAELTQPQRLVKRRHYTHIVQTPNLREQPAFRNLHIWALEKEQGRLTPTTLVRWSRLQTRKSRSKSRFILPSTRMLST